MIKLGVLGVGHLGNIHIKCLKEVPTIELVGFYDPDDKAAQKAMDTHSIQRVESYEALLEKCDAIDIVTPTSSHFELATQALQADKHIFIEKPLAANLTEAKKLITLAQQRKVKIQVGHVERFNPAFLSIQDMSLQPLFIEAHRLAMFNPRGTDVSVVLDLMIHDLDLVLSMVKAPLTTISASGVAVVSKSPDIANVRLEFENGCVANLTASRISMKQMRKIRLFQKDAYLSLDLLEKQSQVIQLFNEPLDTAKVSASLSLQTEEGKKYISIQAPPIPDTNAIQMELAAFAESILNDTTPKVTIQDGYNCLALAHRIMEEIEERNTTFETMSLT